MKILIDTNILIDYISKREPCFKAADSIIMSCANEAISGCLTAYSIMDAFYMTRKEYSVEERKKIILRICKIVEAIGIDRDKIINVLCNDAFSDIEDCLQTECAKEFSADYIVTRNVRDFEHSSVPAIMPEDLLKLLR